MNKGEEEGQSLLRKGPSPGGKGDMRGPPTGPVTTGMATASLVCVSFPIIVQLVLNYLQAVINFIFISSYDDANILAGLGLGMSFYVCFYSSFLIGMTSTITTFAA